MLKAALITFVFFVFLGVCTFWPAGRVAWPMAWVCLGVFATLTVVSFALAEPDLLRERAAPGPGVDRADVALATLGFLGLYPGTLIVAGFDAGRSALAPIPIGIQLAALAVFALGYALALWAVQANPFFATFVRIQSDRGHRLIDTGPYAWVRHPGYAGALIAHVALPLALGSFWALVPALFGVGCFVVRTAHEDRFLSEHLAGYREYRERVPRRLLPGIW